MIDRRKDNDMNKDKYFADMYVHLHPDSLFDDREKLEKELCESDGGVFNGGLPWCFKEYPERARDAEKLESPPGFSTSPWSSWPSF